MAKLPMDFSIQWENQTEFQGLMENVAKAQITYEEAISAVKILGTIYQFTPTTRCGIYEKNKKGDFRMEIVF